jgi:hypothetical protein
MGISTFHSAQVMLGTGRAYRTLIPLGLLAVFGCMMIWVALTHKEPRRDLVRRELDPLDRLIMACLGALLIAPFVIVFILLYNWSSL